MTFHNTDLPQDDFLNSIEQIEQDPMIPNGNAASTSTMPLQNYPNNAYMNGNETMNAQASYPPIVDAQTSFPPTIEAKACPPIEDAQTSLSEIQAPQIPISELPDLERTFRESTIEETSRREKPIPSGQEQPRAIKNEHEVPKSTDVMSVAYSVPAATAMPKHSKNAQRPRKQRSISPLERQESRETQRARSQPFADLEKVCPCTLLGHKCEIGNGQYAPKKHSVQI